MIGRLPVLGAIVLVASLSWRAGAAPSAPSPAVPPSLSVQAEPDLELIGSSIARYWFGRAGAGQAKPLAHRFTVRNNSAAPVTIDHILTSCGCTTASLTLGDRPGTLPLILPPGQTLRVTVSVDDTGIAAGQIQRSADLYLTGASSPAITLEIAGEIAQTARIVPSVLNFGRVRFGSDKTLVVTVTGGGHLAASDPSLRITPASAMAKDGATYRVRLLPTAPPGFLNATLSLVADTPAGAGKTLASVPVLGRVIGPISSSSSAVDFGVLTPGKSATRRFAVTVDPPSPLTVTTTLPEVTATATPTATPTIYAISVTAHAPSTPAALQGTLVLKTTAGFELTIPICSAIPAP